MIDFTGVKAITIPEGNVKKIMRGSEVLWERKGFTNLLPLAINADGTPFVGDNGEKGYRVGYRVNSSVVEVASAQNCVTGYIPVKANQTIRVKNTKKRTGNGYFHWFNSNFTICRAVYYEHYKPESGLYDTTENANGIIEFNAPNEPTLAYFRYSTGVISDESIFTVDEEIV